MNEELLQIFGEPSAEKAAAAIGAFDGIHIGHRHILERTAVYAQERKLIPTAILFDPLPAQFFGRLGPDERLLLRDEQETMLHTLGIERIIFLPFTSSVANITPEDFLETMQAVLRAERLFMGTDFSLGKGRSGTPNVLKSLGEKYGFSAEIIEKDLMDGDVISSTRIRSLLHAGMIPEADRLLGYPFFYKGPIVHGDARGRKLGFPTLNLKIPEGKLTLPNGVYAAYNIIDGVKFASVTNIGVRPTFGLDDRGIVVESFLLNASGNYYGESSHLDFVKMLRPEIRFDSADLLKAQISRDIKTAAELLGVSD